MSKDLCWQVLENLQKPAGLSKLLYMGYTGIAVSLYVYVCVLYKGIEMTIPDKK